MGINIQIIGRLRVPYKASKEEVPLIAILETIIPQTFVSNLQGIEVVLLVFL
jgi:hypothetical protein